MSLIQKWIDIHDRLLLADYSRVRPWMVFFLLISGLFGLYIGWYSDHEFSKHLLVVASFSIGLSMEKFVHFQIRRIEKKHKSI